MISPILCYSSNCFSGLAADFFRSRAFLRFFFANSFMHSSSGSAIFRTTVPVYLTLSQSIFLLSSPGSFSSVKGGGLEFMLRKIFFTASCLLLYCLFPSSSNPCISRISFVISVNLPNSHTTRAKSPIRKSRKGRGSRYSPSSKRRTKPMNPATINSPGGAPLPLS